MWKSECDVNFQSFKSCPQDKNPLAVVNEWLKIMKYRRITLRPNRSLVWYALEQESRHFRKISLILHTHYLAYYKAHTGLLRRKLNSWCLGKKYISYRKMLKPLRIHYLYYVRRFDVQTLNFSDTGLPEERCDTITNSMSRKSRKVFGGKEFFANFTSSPLI